AASVFAAFGARRRRGGQAMRPFGGPVGHPRMQRVGCNAELVRLASDFIERDQPVVEVQRRVLDAFGGDGTCYLLELADELHMLAPFFFGDVVRLLEQQATNKLEYKRRIMPGA